MKTRNFFSSLALYSVLIVGAFVSLFPFYWMIISSFKPKGDMFKFHPDLFPQVLTIQNYIELFTESIFLRNLGNSLFVALCFTLLSVFLCSLCGYAFAKMRFPGRGFLFGVVIATMSLPIEVALLPLFNLMSKFHWVNTYWAVIIPFSAHAWAVFLMRQAMLDIPERIYCDAHAHRWRQRIPDILSGCRAGGQASPGSVGDLTVALASWNDYIWPLIALTENKMMTVPVALALFKSGYPPITAASLPGRS